MPYIITVNHPGFLPEQDPYAVATIKEAREAAQDELAHYIGGSGWDLGDEFYADADELPDSGGTIGPLPDGYVIDVRRVTWTYALAFDFGGDAPNHEQQAEILDAYNHD